MISCMLCRQAKQRRCLPISCCSKTHAPCWCWVLDAVVSKHMPTVSSTTSHMVSNWNVAFACASPVPDGILTMPSFSSRSRPVTPTAILSMWVGLRIFQVRAVSHHFTVPVDNQRWFLAGQKLLSNAAVSWRTVFNTFATDWWSWQWCTLQVLSTGNWQRIV